MIKNDSGIFISQNSYVLDLLKKLNMLNCKTCFTTMNINDKLCFYDWIEKVDKYFYRSQISGLL